MKVLMFGWEFPPFFAGGVGMVCYELTKEMCKRGDIKLTYVMPSGPKHVDGSHVRLLIANNLVRDDRITVKRIDSAIGAYMTEQEYIYTITRLGKKGKTMCKKDNTLTLYGKNLLEEVYRFAEKAAIIAEEEDFDVIHAHDWTTFPAAIKAKEKTGRPLVVHVHITEFDKSGGLGANSAIYDIEKAGMMTADKVIAVSNFTKQMLIDKYGIPGDKIEVIHNGPIAMNQAIKYRSPIQDNKKIVLCAGRVTLQKGQEFLVEAARKVVDHYPDVLFVVAGSGDMLTRIIDKVTDYGLQDHFYIHGFYSRDEAEKFFSMADLCVMPSVSEPFGVIPLEAMHKGTPVIISKQSGCSEVIKNALAVDFWDIDEMANQIVNVLRYSELRDEMAARGLEEIKTFTWEKPASRCMDVYKEVTGW